MKMVHIAFYHEDCLWKWMSEGLQLVKWQKKLTEIGPKAVTMIEDGCGSSHTWRPAVV